MKQKHGLVIILLCFFSSTVYAQATASNLDVSVSSTGDFVLGRQITSQFEYEINDPYKPVDTALVIDESGSMRGVMNDAKSGAKSYVDNTRTSQGDENAIVEFESSASTIQSLTDSKQDAKDAIDTISAGGGTDLPEGVSQGTNALSSGSNSQQVMIVLADGGGGDPGTQADNARSQGIEIHGIMYGSGASTSEFESLTDASDCSTNSNENDDGDNCWYAEAGTVNQVYNSIRESTQVETDVSLKMQLRDFAYETESYDQYNELAGSNQEFIRNFQDVSDGTYSQDFNWYPTQYGDNVELITGDSLLEVNSDGVTNTYSLDNSKLENVKYVDFDVSNTSIIRSSSGIEINFTIRNIGNIASKSREVWVADGVGPMPNFISRTINSLNSGETQKYSIDISESHSVVNTPEDIYVRADPSTGSAYWDGTSYGEGQTLEPDENNNIVNIGYPPKLKSVTPTSPTGVSWGDTIQPSFTYDHSDTGQLTGTYNYTNATTQRGSKETMTASVLSGDDILTTDSQYFIDYAERWYNFTVKAVDDNGAVGLQKTSYFVQNPGPIASVVEPSDEGYVSDFPVQLRTEVNDQNSEYHNRFLDVKIYDSSGNTLASESVSSGDLVSYEWDVPDATDSEYDWTVEIEDKWDTEAYTFSFNKIIGQTFRSRVRTDLNYSSLIMNAGNNKYSKFTIRNEVSNTKNLTVTLSGASAEFLNGEPVKQLPNFPGQSQETYTLRINPQNPTSDDLTVTVRNNDLGVNTTTSIPVRVLENYRQSSRDVPGIGIIQLLFIASVATVLYSVRL